MSEQDAGAILERRARALAVSPSSAGVEAGSPHLTFSLGAEVWAVDLGVVLEVFNPGPIAMLPGAELPLAGLAVWRGEVVSVIDLAPALALPKRAAAPRLIVLGIERPVIALAVDDVHGVIPIDAAALRVSRGSAAGGYALGVTGDSVVVLAVADLLQFYG